MTRTRATHRTTERQPAKTTRETPAGGISDFVRISHLAGNRAAGNSVVQAKPAKFTETRGKLWDRSTIRITDGPNRFSAFLGKEKEDVGHIKYAVDDNPAAKHSFLAGQRGVLKLHWLEAFKARKRGINGVGQLLMYQFAKAAVDGDRDILIPNATVHGPVFYGKLGFQMIGDWLTRPNLPEQLPQAQQDMLANLSQHPIPHQRNATPGSHVSDKPSQGSMEMYANSDAVLQSLVVSIGRYWKSSALP